MAASGACFATTRKIGRKGTTHFFYSLYFGMTLMPQTTTLSDTSKQAFSFTCDYESKSWWRPPSFSFSLHSRTNNPSCNSQHWHCPNDDCDDASHDCCKVPMDIDTRRVDDMRRRQAEVVPDGRSEETLPPECTSWRLVVAAPPLVDDDTSPLVAASQRDGLEECYLPWSAQPGLDASSADAWRVLGLAPPCRPGPC